LDFSFTPEQEALRKEFDEFFRKAMKEAPPGWVPGMESLYDDEGWGFHRGMLRKVAEKGWLVPHWPKEYGGRDAPIIEQLILHDVVGYHRAPA